MSEPPYKYYEDSTKFQTIAKGKFRRPNSSYQLLKYQLTTRCSVKLRRLEDEQFETKIANASPSSTLSLPTISEFFPEKTGPSKKVVLQDFLSKVIGVNNAVTPNFTSVFLQTNNSESDGGDRTNDCPIHKSHALPCRSFLRMKLKSKMEVSADGDCSDLEEDSAQEDFTIDEDNDDDDNSFATNFQDKKLQLLEKFVKGNSLYSEKIRNAVTVLQQSLKLNPSCTCLGKDKQAYELFLSHVGCLFLSYLLENSEKEAMYGWVLLFSNYGIDIVPDSVDLDLHRKQRLIVEVARLLLNKNKLKSSVMFLKGKRTEIHFVEGAAIFGVLNLILEKVKEMNDKENKLKILSLLKDITSTWEFQ